MRPLTAADSKCYGSAKYNKTHTSGDTHAKRRTHKSAIGKSICLYLFFDLLIVLLVEGVQLAVEFILDN